MSSHPHTEAVETSEFQVVSADGKTWSFDAGSSEVRLPEYK